MFRRPAKVYYYVLEGMGSLACGFYGNYIFFLLRDRFGLGNLGNLSVSAFQGLVFAVAAWQGGRFAQRHGYFTALRLGLAGMIAALLAGWVLPGLPWQLLVLAAWTGSMCFTWPALEALVSQNEPASQLPRRVGIYNVTWATCSALSYFVGGAVLDRLGLASIYWLPAVVHVLALVLVGWVSGHPEASIQPATASREISRIEPHEAQVRVDPSPPTLLVASAQVSQSRTFLHLAWMANPFACIGINTVLAMMPGLARDLHLSNTSAGLFCSIWFFGRLAAFIILWQWPGWHYRFRMLLGAFVGLMAGFALLLITRQLWLLFLAQVIFGLSVGLIYYSSLYYSMDAGDTHGEHGGLHEAAMGTGNCIGPATGALALWLAPGSPQAGTGAVSGLLLAGLTGLIVLWYRRIFLVRRNKPAL